MKHSVGAPSRLHLYPLPKCHVPFDVLGGGFGVRVIPSRVGVGFAIYRQGMVGGHALPGAGGVGVAVGQVPGLYRFFREIMVILHNHRVVTFGNGLPVPDRFHVF